MSSSQAASSSSSSTKQSKPSQITTRLSSSLSSHFAMIELKQRILTSLSKLSDRDTHQIAVEDLEKIIQSLSSEGIPMLLNCLYDASNDPKPSVKKESLRFLAFLSTSHTDLTLPHLSKIISHIVRKLKDSDSGVRDACRDAIGVLSSQYLGGGNGGDNGNVGSLVSLFAKPLFEAMGEQNKVVQAGSSICMAKMVESAVNPPIVAFQKLCPKVCKYLNSQNFLARSALLPVVASLSQVGAIAPQNLPTFLQILHECLQSSDWGTRKAAAETLSALASYSKQLIADDTSSTISALDACRFDKVKPARDSINEALQLWKKIADKGGNEVSEGPNTVSHDGKVSQLAKSERIDSKVASPDDRRLESVKNAENTSTSDSLLKAKGSSITDKTVGILKKKALALSDKELNPEFFQKLAARGSDDLPVEVVVPRKCPNSSTPQGEDGSEANCRDDGSRSRNMNNESDAVHGSASVKYHNNERGADDITRDKWTEQRIFRGKDSKAKPFDVDDTGTGESSQRDSPSARSGFHKSDGHVEGSFMNNKGNWLAIQRQLSLLERQQTNLMNMLQDFMGGSHESMVTLENRVRGLERVVEDMARDLSVSSGRRGGNFMAGYEGSSSRSLGKYNTFSDYSTAKLGRGGEGRVPFMERYSSSEGTRGRDPLWRSDMSEAWDSYSYGPSRNGHMSSRRAVGVTPNDVRSPRSEHDDDQVGNRRGWDKGPGSIRFGEGPSARSVWQASKDEATLEAIRVAGEDNGTSRVVKRVAIPELTAEAMGDDNGGQDRGPIWDSWTNAMDALHVGDIDTAYAEVLSTGDELLVVKLMDRSGPVLDQLSNEVASDILHAIGQFLLEQNLFDIGISWIQQLVDLVVENGPDFLGIAIESKRVLLLNLHEASSTIDPPEDWEGATPDQLMLQLASAWGIDLRNFDK
ncbi:hypothetical protein AQUCO_04500115v1 [Aquilegia coerulea]|uniref:TOG domain-containing protein n=1 Tax=Aquilegia coerulea TaxID=218851 RepID=A0A2G5CLZ9_AQUCA|nr:hypothetical protein AQUCO_04500115v1 [Aquilegia coerulea]